MEVERHETVGALAGEWDELADRAGALPWARPGWVGPWIEAFGSGRPVVLALRREGRLAAVLPLLRRGRALRTPTNWHSPAFAPAAEDGEAAAALVRSALGVRPSELQLGFLLRDDAGSLRAAAAGAGYRLLERPLGRSPFVPVEGDLDAYLASGRISPKRRKDLQRQRRRLEDGRTVAVEVHDGRERLDELLEEGFAVEGSTWKVEQGTAIVSQPQTRRFYTEVARAFAARGALRLFFLRVDGRPVAFEYTLDDGRRVYDVKGGYVDEFKSYSPGLLLVFELIAYAHRQGRESLELLGSEEPWKATFTDLTRERTALHAFAPLAGLPRFAAQAYGRPLARRLLALRAGRR